MSEDWREFALCAQTDLEAFFPETGTNPRAAYRVCASCEVREQCLAWALEIHPVEGVWGGTSIKQRRAMVRERRVAA